MKTTAWILHNDLDMEVEVDFKYYKGSRGHRDKHGMPTEPDDPPEIEVLSVTAEDGVELTNLSDEATKEIEAKCWESLGDL